MVSGAVPFRASNIRSLHKDILKCRYTVPDHVSPEAGDLIRSMLTLYPNQRPDVTKILAHPWLTKHIEIPAPPIVDFIDNQQNAAARHGFLEGPINLDTNIINKVIDFGYPRTYLINTLKAKELNHATTTYYLLQNSV